MTPEGRLSTRSLRAMKRRWQADLVRLEANYRWTDRDESSPWSEVQRNLLTAIVEIDGMITRRHPHDPPTP